MRRVWPAANGILKAVRAHVRHAVDAVGPEVVVLALLAVGDHRRAGRLEALDRVPDGRVVQRLEGRVAAVGRRRARRAGPAGAGCCRWVRSGRGHGFVVGRSLETGRGYAAARSIRLRRRRQAPGRPAAAGAARRSRIRAPDPSARGRRRRDTSIRGSAAGRRRDRRRRAPRRRAAAIRPSPSTRARRRARSTPARSRPAPDRRRNRRRPADRRRCRARSRRCSPRANRPRA